MGRHSTLRASDADREQVVDRLRKAAAEGRILAEELEQRVSAALRARTYADLAVVTSDLPSPRPRRHSPYATSAAMVVLAVSTIVVVALAVAFVLTGIAVWLLWMVVAWTVFGRRRLGPPPWVYARRVRHGLHGPNRGRPGRHWA